MIVHDYVHDGDEPGVGDPVQARERPLGHAEPSSRTRVRRRELGVPDDVERARLARTFGATLRRERGVRTQQQLADAAKLDRKTIVRLENGQRRPTAASVWAIARALRSDLRSRVALDERLRRAAGSSFRDYGKRPHRAREAMRVQLAVEQGDGPVFGPGDNLGMTAAAFLDEIARGFEP